MTATLNPLTPEVTTVSIEGHVSYSDNRHAWNTIRFRKDLLREFPQLTQRTNRIKYKIILCRNQDAALQRLHEKTEGDAQLPLLLYLFQEKERNEQVV